jgi:hypothetical protein
VQPVSATHTFEPAIFLSYLHAFFPGIRAFHARIFKCLSVINIFFSEFLSAFSDLVDLNNGTAYTFDFPLLFDLISFFILSLFLIIISFFIGHKGVAFLILNISLLFSVMNWYLKLWKK